ncbi:RECEPTOR-LIKE PROTEIN KINASE ANXUR2 [Salix purpurea]|uniref:RECEPTOR-LIKE PROTEIN KINASE ANXUR2 n=1 Tax=Salix purpurea TaxID=77065 RepID=A0A9Q0WXX8_SALPP|nr:RECEPTOR-LIKE PROTEIN KINASE ANXUR2 [Salix purpurea]
MHANICFLFSLACFTALFNELYVSANGAQPQSLSLNCGSENGGTDGDGRKWESDVKYITGKHPHARAQYQDSSIDSEVPYMDARIFTSEATYNLPITEKTRYWLRLSFYPSEYSGLDISDSYFSVVAGGVTLLNNFSASITAQALTQAYLIKEYSLAPMNSRILNVTFKPADKPDAFAFINAIELVPTPDLFGSGTMVGFSDQTFDATEMLANHIAKASHKAFKTDNKIVMGTVGGVGALLFAVVCVAVYQRTKRIPGFDSNTSTWLPVYGNSHTVSKSSISGKSSQSSHLSTLAQGLCRHFTLPEMQRACKNFDESNVIGVGGFGKVYKGVIDQATKVAIKRSNPQSEQGKKGIIEDIIDPHIKGKITPECLKKFAETADKCLAESGPERPNMGDVLWNLEFALQLQDNPEGSKHRSQGEGNETSEESTGNRNLEMHRKNLSLGSISEVNEGSDDSGDIFSQIVNPKGR